MIETERQLAKELLVQKVAAGELSIDKAEAEARALGLPGLAISPDPERFDPQNETDWTILMALAWIMWRDLGRVRSVWDKSRAGCSSWSHIGRVIPDEADPKKGVIEPKYALQEWGQAITSI